MRYLLDTNVLSSLQWRADPASRWIERRSAYDMAISVASVLELEIGARRLERRDPAQGARLRQWIDSTVIVAFDDRILPIDLRVIRVAAGFHVPDAAPERDAVIAATAVVHGLTVVTRNVRDFERTGVPVLDPWAVAR